LVAVIQEAWIGGVSTRRVDEIAQAMGLSGISKSQVSKLRKEIDERVKAFLDRPLERDWPYLWLDATYLKVREGGRIVSVAAIIAVAANTEGRRGLGIGPSEAETFRRNQGLTHDRIRPRRKTSIGGANVSTATAVTGPTPGMVCKRLVAPSRPAASRSRLSRSRVFSLSAAICSSKSPPSSRTAIGKQEHRSQWRRLTSSRARVHAPPRPRVRQGDRAVH
jgi:hypothetical protein